MSKLLFPLTMLFVLLVLVSATVGLAIGLGYALNWLVPALEISTCVLTVLGAMTFWGLIVCVVIVLVLQEIDRQRSSQIADSDDDEDDDGQDLLETHAELVADRIFTALSSRLDFGTRRRRR